MVLLHELPTELLLIIIGLLGSSSTKTESSRSKTRAAILPFAQTNRVLWVIAKPFLYHDIEILLQVNDIKVSEPYHLYLQTSLLCRSLQENPTLFSHVRTLELAGLVPGSPSRFGDLENEAPQRRGSSGVYYTASKLASLIASCTNVRSFKVHDTLRANLFDESNQILLICIKSMTRLNSLRLTASSKTKGGSLVHLLNVASTHLESLVIGPRSKVSRNFVERQMSYPLVPIPRFNLDYLRLPASRLSVATFLPWIGSLNRLVLTDVMFKDGRTSQGPNLSTMLMPVASTLRHLSVVANEEFHSPSLSDFDLSQCFALQSFTFRGPWWIKQTDDPAKVCKTLFSRPYQSLCLDFTTGTCGDCVPPIMPKAVQVLRVAFNLALHEDCCPDKFKFHVAPVEDVICNCDHAVAVATELEAMVDDLVYCGVEVEYSIEGRGRDI
jgi:hypothetical protein